MLRRAWWLVVWVALLGCSNDDSPDATSPDESMDHDAELQPDQTMDLELDAPWPVPCEFDEQLEHDWFGLRWQLRSEDESVCVLLDRRDDSDPDIIYKARPYTVLSFVVGYRGERESISEASSLTYTSSHHNWADVVSAQGSTLKYVLHIDYDGENEQYFRYTIEAQLASGTIAWGPIRVWPVVN